MATPPQSFTLDKNLFNQSAYQQMRQFWFDGAFPDNSAPPFSTLQKWYGMGKTDEEKAQFDNECRTNFGPALESIGPAHLALPTFKSFEDDLGQANELAAPFLSEIKASQKDSDKEAASTFLSLLLILDQMPRNIYRDQEGLRLVYNFYDRLAFSLIHSVYSTLPTLMSNEVFVAKPIFSCWLYLPLIHAEHLPSHELAKQLFERTRSECEAKGDQAGLEFVAKGKQAQDMHSDPMEKFGRYPHRNECLGRKNTAEEDAFLETADTFGVKQNKKKAAEKEEL